MTAMLLVSEILSQPDKQAPVAIYSAISLSSLSTPITSSLPVAPKLGDFLQPAGGGMGFASRVMFLDQDLLPHDLCRFSIKPCSQVRREIEVAQSESTRPRPLHQRSCHRLSIKSIPGT
jgi:hypothetical protein